MQSTAKMKTPHYGGVFIAHYWSGRQFLHNLIRWFLISIT